MKQFFGALLGSFVGLFIVGLICVFIIIGSISTMFKDLGSDNNIKTVKENSVLHIKLEQAILERTENNPYAAFFKPNNADAGAQGLTNILKSIDKAQKDERVKGIYLEIDGNFASSLAHLEEIRNTLVSFKKSGKFIYSHATIYQQGAYYLASNSDKIYLSDGGMVLWKGLKAEVSMMKGLLDKLKVNMQVNRHGKYKSAVEPYMYDKMSAENKFQLRELLQHAWGNVLSQVSTSRKIDVALLNQYADSLSAMNADAALERKMIDGIAYSEDVELAIAKKMNINKDELNLLSVYDYKGKSLKGSNKETESNDSKIAILYADGTIMDGNSTDEGTVCDQPMIEAIEKIKKDDKIKAVVLRINSPGGSSFASDRMYKNIKDLNKSKPVIVSMANYAASGGYYIACGGRYIIAEPTTITGSIGVFQTIPDISKAMKEHLGISHDTVLTNKSSDFISVNRPLSELEKNVLQKFVDKTYDSFIKIVSESRKLPLQQVDELAQGRVWLGLDALNNKLVDELGGIETAKAKAATIAGISVSSKTVEFPKRENPLSKFMGANAEVKVSVKELAELKALQDISKTLISSKLFDSKVPLTWMPFELKID
jgi:protease IV